jgi:hypothetical protein
MPRSRQLGHVRSDLGMAPLPTRLGPDVRASVRQIRSDQ